MWWTSVYIWNFREKCSAVAKQKIDSKLILCICYSYTFSRLFGPLLRALLSNILHFYDHCGLSSQKGLSHTICVLYTHCVHTVHCTVNSSCLMYRRLRLIIIIIAVVCRQQLAGRARRMVRAVRQFLAREKSVHNKSSYSPPPT